MISGLHIRTAIYGLLGLIAAAVISASAVYVLTSTSIPLVLVCFGICAYAVIAARTALKPVMWDANAFSPGRYLRVVLTFLLLLAPIYMLCQLMLFLAAEWHLVWKIHPGLRVALRFPDSVVQGIVGFFAAVWDAFVGGATVAPSGRHPPVAEPSFVSALLSWVGSSIREILVGAIGTILAAFVLARMKQ